MKERSYFFGFPFARSYATMHSGPILLERIVMIEESQHKANAIFEPSHIHIDVHVHLDGAVGVAPIAAERGSSYREFDQRSAAGET